MVLVIFATWVIKRKVEIKIHAFFVFLVIRLLPLESHCAVYTVMQIDNKLDYFLSALGARVAKITKTTTVYVFNHASRCSLRCECLALP